MQYRLVRMTACISIKTDENNPRLLKQYRLYLNVSLTARQKYTYLIQPCSVKERQERCSPDNALTLTAKYLLRLCLFLFEIHFDSIR